jgi:hypothetical protein
VQAVPVKVKLHGDSPPIKTPVIRGFVPTDVRVAGSSEGTIDLGTFSAARGKTKKTFLYAPQGTRLELVHKDPPILQVSLKEEADKGAESKWQVSVTFPGGGLGGSLPEESELILEARNRDGQTRRVRIPVTGTALSD